MGKILAIETSCDETAASVVEGTKVLSNIVYTQPQHENFGGVVPEVASRSHLKGLVSVVEQALKVSGSTFQDLSAVAFTQGPGLMGALLVGACYARGVAMGLSLPIVPINHLRAHIWALFIEGGGSPPDFPFLCLIASGGHTQVVLVRGPSDMSVLGETRDDAVGEAYDKSAKILGLPYPGGKWIDHYAEQGDPHRFKLPLVNLEGISFSFSGIKTALLYLVRKEVQRNPSFLSIHLTDLCASVQKALVDCLIVKLEEVVKTYEIKRVAVVGGVSANRGLRKQLGDKGENSGWQVFFPEMAYTTDNAAMVAVAAHYEGGWSSLDYGVKPRFPLEG